MTLPIILAIPHAGSIIPGPLGERLLLDADQVRIDGDDEAARIYALQDEVAHFLSFPLARCVIDVNRPEDDLGEDGVVKQLSCQGDRVWSRPLTSDEIAGLVKRWHRPWHRALDLAARTSPRPLFGVDGHTMAPEAPEIAQDTGERRPRACIGDGHGSFPRPWCERLARSLQRALGGTVTINDPFRGGWTSRSHGREIPWVQIEMRRGGPSMIEEKRSAVLEALRDLVRAIETRALPPA